MITTTIAKAFMKALGIQVTIDKLIEMKAKIASVIKLLVVAVVLLILIFIGLILMNTIVISNRLDGIQNTLQQLKK